MSTTLPPEMPDAEALLVALVIAPGIYSRNKFFEMFQDPHLRLARRRAQLVRSIVKDLTEPWPHPGEIPAHPGPSIEAEFERNGEYHLSYAVSELGYRRSVVLGGVEAAALRYALSRARQEEVSLEDRSVVESCLARLSALTMAEKNEEPSAD